MVELHVIRKFQPSVVLSKQVSSFMLGTSLDASHSYELTGANFRPHAAPGANHTGTWLAQGLLSHYYGVPDSGCIEYGNIIDTFVLKRYIQSAAVVGGMCHP